MVPKDLLELPPDAWSNLGSKSKYGLVYWGLTPQQQPGSYRGGDDDDNDDGDYDGDDDDDDDDDVVTVSLVEETGNTRRKPPTYGNKSKYGILSTYHKLWNIIV